MDTSGRIYRNGCTLPRPQLEVEISFPSTFKPLQRALKLIRNSVVKADLFPTVRVKIPVLLEIKDKSSSVVLRARIDHPLLPSLTAKFAIPRKAFDPLFGQNYKSETLITLFREMVEELINALMSYRGYELIQIIDCPQFPILSQVLEPASVNRREKNA